MRAVVQRVLKAEVRVDGLVKGSIGKGLLVYAGIEKGDTDSDLDYIAAKIRGLRIFEDAEGKMNLDVSETGSVLAVSQFTLLADCRKGRRPAFDGAERPEQAKALYEKFVDKLSALGLKVATGEFQAHMEVASVNDGPVTILLDSRKLF